MFVNFIYILFVFPKQKDNAFISFVYYFLYQQWNKSSGHRHDEDVDFPPMEISQKIDLVPSEKHKTRCTFWDYVDYVIVDCAFSYLSLLHLFFEYSGLIAFFSETTLYMAVLVQAK
jgi:hypothetical protein